MCNNNSQCSKFLVYRRDDSLVPLLVEAAAQKRMDGPMQQFHDINLIE